MAIDGYSNDIVTQRRGAVLFDLDGTLTNPRSGITRCIQHAMNSLGYPPPSAEQMDWCIGPPLKRTFATLFGSENDAILERAIALYRERFETVGMFENELYEGIPQILSSLRGSGYRTFVVTSKPAIYARRIVDYFRLSAFFEGIYGSELNGVRSDKSDLIAHVLETEKLVPVWSLMVGDREHDVIGSNKCEVPCIGVTYGFGTSEELRKRGAIAIASSPKEIPPLVRAYFVR